MRVRMIRFGGIWHEPLMTGQVYDVPEELANAMFADGRAVPDVPIEVAVERPKPNTAKRTGKAERR